MPTKSCKHCHLPITHTDHNLALYCNRHDCIRGRSNLLAVDNRRRAGRANRKCKLCGRSVDVPIETPRGEAICNFCKAEGGDEIKLTKKNTCEVCGKRKKHPGFKRLCWLCYVTDGDYDADSMKYGEGYLR